MGQCGGNANSIDYRPEDLGDGNAKSLAIMTLEELPVKKAGAGNQSRPSQRASR